LQFVTSQRKFIVELIDGPFIEDHDTRRADCRAQAMMTGTCPKVLLVDDLPANLLTLEAVLGPLECELVSARSGREALERVQEHEFAAALLDVQMPEMDGYELARRLRDELGLRELPIVFVTAMADSKEALHRAYEVGGADFLYKPIDVQVVRRKLQFFLDLYSSRRLLQAEVEAHRQTLAEVEAFTDSVSHDLRRPLRPMDGFCEVLLQDYGERLDDRARDYLQRIRGAAQRMGQLIDDLFELSRIGRSDLSRQMVDLSALVTGLARELRDEDPRPVQLVCAPGVSASGDGRLLRIAVEHLLRNAWKFTRPQAQPRVQFGQVDHDGAPAYFVSDNGVGFDNAYAGKMFQPFQRLHGSDFPGTGIGLAIVHRIVRRHQGRIWAESALGQGATFYFTLPPA
jgi:two-component system, sensor histidine kinase and response regulator